MIKNASYYQDPYCFEFSSKVISCVKNNDIFEITLDSTFFYPTGGGQPCDRGTIDNIEVTDIFERDDEIIHVTGEYIEPGKVCLCRIDKEYRLTFMRNHTGEHIFTGHLHKLTGGDNIGFHMNEDIITVDFNCEIDGSVLNEIETKTNETILSNIGIKCYFPSDESIKSISYRQKKELTGPIRLVEVPGVDICACCGLHVKRSSEVGLVKVISYQKFKSGCRIQLTAGYPAMKLFIEGFRQLQLVSGMTSKPITEVSKGVSSLKEENTDLKNTVSSWKNKYLSLAAEKAEMINGFSVVTADECEPADLVRLCSIVKSRCDSVLAMSGSGDEKSYVCISAADDRIKETVSNISNYYTIKGGGRNGIYQGWISSCPEKIIDIL